MQINYRNHFIDWTGSRIIHLSPRYRNVPSFWGPKSVSHKTVNKQNVASSVFNVLIRLIVVWQRRRKRTTYHVMGSLKYLKWSNSMGSEMRVTWTNLHEPHKRSVDDDDDTWTSIICSWDCVLEILSLFRWTVITIRTHQIFLGGLK